MAEPPMAAADGSPRRDRAGPASCQRELAYVARIQMCTPIMFESMEVQDEYNASHSFAILGVPSVRLQTMP
ncbi:hypothetical protein HGM15179_001124 [Zosterops borbonicus]|uniref:Uncharacterized protein n=1 Tax=Zosterops borbonicus TaxID=364589 RepID=A0A8K1GVI1_9PASS|nr:hypothetical protein HGM15179_001124 [Zosterops borbonicus]